jgi:hypothetical protein
MSLVKGRKECRSEGEPLEASRHKHVLECLEQLRALIGAELVAHYSSPLPTQMTTQVAELRLELGTVTYSIEVWKIT